MKFVQARVKFGKALPREIFWLYQKVKDSVTTLKIFLKVIFLGLNFARETYIVRVRYVN